MQLRHFVEPGLKNIALLLTLWYTGIIAYTIIGVSNVSLWESILFYTKHSWPNFLLCYTLIVWVIPKYLLRKKFLKLSVSCLTLLIFYIAVRYCNHILNFSNYYYFYSTTPTGTVLKKLSTTKIISSESIRGFQFIFIAFTYRLFIDWRIIEQFSRKIETEKLKADLAMLRYQLNPHFLFNTINNIYYLAIIKSEKTPNALLKLSELLRYVLNEKDELVPLEKEINHLKEFIELHQIRFPDEEVKITIQGESLATKFNVPPLLLITFIENAFKHGKQGTIEDPVTIGIKIENGTLFYKVENIIDNNLYKEEISGIGKNNLEKRLNLLYPNRHKITFETSNNKYVAQLEIPVS